MTWEKSRFKCPAEFKRGPNYLPSHTTLITGASECFSSVGSSSEHCEPDQHHQLRFINGEQLNLKHFLKRPGSQAMPETPMPPAKLTVSVTQQVVLVWFSAQSCTVHSEVHKSQKKNTTLKLKSLDICKKMEARSLLQRACPSLLWCYELRWNTCTDTALGRPAAKTRCEELITFGRAPAVARRAMEAQSPALRFFYHQQSCPPTSK